jgi:nitrate/TMAO reductase-like tetraheme cytochrome c subunit
MITPFVLLMSLIAVTVVLLLTLVFRPSITHSRAGKILAFLAIFILPVMAGSGGAAAHMEKSKETKFCLSCHIMEPYGQSLHVDDPNYLAARHYQNHRVPADSACYTCHTDYGMYGDIKSKLRGLRHVYIQYLGTAPNPIKLYNPYNNRECLHCHEGARNFEEGAIHNADPDTLPQVKANKLSCTSSGCHDVVHNVSHLKEVKFWSEK